MKPRFRTAAVTALLFLPIVAGGFLLQEPPARANVQLFEQVMSLVSNRYVDSLPAGDIYAKAAAGLVKELRDPYSQLFSPQASADFARGTGGRYGGTGMLLGEDSAGTYVAQVFPHTPAADAGVQEGDHIIAVDGKTVVGVSSVDIATKLRGDIGTKVRVTYHRPGVAQPIDLSFVRREVHIPAVEYATILDNSVGYIPIQTFNENVVEEVTDAIRKLSAKGAKGYVIDLRGNGGGIVEQALQLSGLFLKDSQEIVSVRSRGQPDEISRAGTQHMLPGVPLVVMVDGGTASASEIVAGALQDHDRALVVGTTSFGKGLVQSVYGLDGGYALKLTTGKWYTPSGRSIHRERKLNDAGQLVEVRPDSLETDSERLARPKYRSDDGRIVYGGGGITPDVVVRGDTLTTLEQGFFRSVAASAGVISTELDQYSRELKDSLKTPTLALKPAWTQHLMTTLAAKGMKIEPKYAAVADSILAEQLAVRTVSKAFGDGEAKQLTLNEDNQLVKAIELLKRATSQQQLFAVAKSQ
ncbi:MAG TPA: S41 family peptidase [Gemmatimonadaceae bacterium]|nr:S41 family peptidase [Gemmatimonadaceae bacterium]